MNNQTDYPESAENKLEIQMALHAKRIETVLIKEAFFGYWAIRIYLTEPDKVMFINNN